MVQVLDTPRTQRLPQIDDLRTVMVGWIIGGHALLGYTAIGGWPYDEVNEVTFDPRSELILSALLGPTALFVIGTFFFLAGLFAQPAMARRACDRGRSEVSSKLGTNDMQKPAPPVEPVDRLAEDAAGDAPLTRDSACDPESPM